MHFEPRAMIIQINSSLSGSPYSFPTDKIGLEKITAVCNAMEKINHNLEQLMFIEDLPSTLTKSLRAREIYESNAIEFLGADLRITDEVIETRLEEHSSIPEFVEWAMTEGIKNDKHLFDIIGLTAARELSRQMSSNIDRPITEADIRALHKQIMGNDPLAGKYKIFLNRIDGNNHHIPVSPADTPAAMNEFTKWLNSLTRRGSRSWQSIVKAAAVHAWLTHIHPFSDGNGRIARLLANLILARENMPPLIIKSDSHRTRYIEALDFSDRGGDLSKLIRIFCKAEERVIDEMHDPHLAQLMFEQDIGLSIPEGYKAWTSNVMEFTRILKNICNENYWKVEFSGVPSPSEFNRMCKGLKAQKTEIFKIMNNDGIELGIIYLGYRPEWIKKERKAMDINAPCFFLAFVDLKNPVNQYIKLDRNSGVKGVTMFLLDSNSRIATGWGHTNAPIAKFQFQDLANSIFEVFQCLQL